MKKTRISSREKRKQREPKKIAPRKKKIFDTLNTRTEATPRDEVFFRGNAAEEKERETLHCALLKREREFEEKKREPRASTLSLSLSLSLFYISRDNREKSNKNGGRRKRSKTTTGNPGPEEHRPFQRPLVLSSLLGTLERGLRAI